jgi:molecular chaperone Hsp33
LGCYHETVDQLQRGIGRDRATRVVAAMTTDLVRDACERHELRGIEAVVLGRALTAGCLMATLTKNDEERLRIDIRGSGPVGTILVDSQADGSVRGCLGTRLDAYRDAPMVDGRQSIKEVVGHDGSVTVTRDVGLEHQYQGSVPMQSGEIDVDLEHYLTHSEQLPSALICEVMLDASSNVLRSGGVLCQIVPGATSTRLDQIRATFQGGLLRDLLRSERSTEDLMGFGLLGGEYEAVAGTMLRFSCPCGPERALSVVSTLGADEIDSLADEPGETEVRCSFCGARYMLGADELHALAARLRGERS